MTDRTLAIDKIRVESAPGFAGGFDVNEFSPGVNIIYGPNGVGKSTLARSLLGLLWQEKAANSELTGWFTLGDDDWRVEVRSSSSRYQQDGNDADAPNLPAMEHADRYELALHELLQRDTDTTGSFADTVQQESIGGYDLDAAYRALEFDNSQSTRRISEYETAEKARKGLREAKREAESRQREQRKLPRLEAELKEASEAQSRAEALELALEYARAEQDLEDATERLAGFSDQLSEMDGSEAQKADSLKERIDEKREAIAAAESKKTTAQEEIDAAALPDDGVSESTIDELRTYKDKLDNLEATRESIERELEGLRERRDEDRTDLPLDVETEALEAIEPAEWGTLQEFLEDVDELHARQELREAVIEWLGNGTDPSIDVSTLERGQQELEKWLAAPDPSDHSSDNTGFQTATISAVVLAAAGLVGAVTNLLFLILVVVAIVIFVYGYRQREQADDTDDTRAASKAAFQRLNLDAPDSWTADAVQNRLIELYTTRAEAIVTEERTAKREEFAPDAASLERKEHEIQVQREQLQSEHGIKPATDLELAVLAHGIRRWKKAHADVTEKQGELDQVESQIQRVQQTLESKLTQYGYGAVDSAGTAHNYIRNLNDRRQKHDTARANLDDATDTLQTAENALSDLQSKRDAIFTELGLDSSDTNQLAALCKEVEAYQDAQNTVTRIEHTVEDAETKFKQHAASDAAMLDKSISELEAAKDEAETTADSYHEITNEITRIEERISQAKKRSDVADARKAKERAFDALQTKLENDAEAMVGHALVERLREATETTDRPDVFNRAGELLQKITADRYKLEFDNGEFRAFDTAERKGLALDELSSGTQLQVLLAVRLAFVETKEQGTKLPLILDETLANSDDTRAIVIINSLLELARDGRQIFYFTAQGDEVAKWKQALTDAKEIPFSVIDLGEITDHGEQAEIPTTTLPTIERPSLPTPTDHSHESYGEELDVPQFSLWTGAGSAHIWYVVEDVELLYDLLSDGVKTWGQLSELLKRTTDEPITEDEALLTEIKHNGQALEKLIEYWEIGRGDPVDRQALEATSAVTSRFIDRVSELSDELNGNAEAILDAIDNKQVSGFRSDKRDDLETYFRENGYIDQTETMEPTLIRARLVNHLASNGLSKKTARTRVDSLLERLGVSRQDSLVEAEISD